ncbi:acylphosphatase [Streptococcus sp. DD13]|uniref:acylphosphatase n=1 Tax=Streptococcus sp. DD13 TaxID=1777881 RepID=UPI00079C1F4E|nr:acylphosphatase [Streptococcus sp. DD13]KXT78195.1 putative nucleoside phosphatase [Streptococcus sp. DD13]
MKKLKMIASGRVQGVGFRWGVKMLADQLGDIQGAVWNEDNGTVTIHAQSNQDAKLSQFAQEIRKGPTPFSKVTYLDITLSNFPDYPDFRIQN